MDAARIVYTYSDSDRQIKATYFDANNLEVPVEIVVLSVVPGSTAQRIGLAPGDRILSYDGEQATSIEQVVNLVTDLAGPASRTWIIRRRSQARTFKVAPGRLGINLGSAPVSTRQTQ